MFLSRIGTKRCCLIRSQAFKLSLEQSDEIVCFFTYWYQKLRVDRKVLGWVWSEMVVAHWSQGEWMNEWMNWADFLHADANSGKLKLASTIFYKIFISHQMIALQKLWEMFFISSKMLFSFRRYSNFCISVFPSFSHC